MTPNGRRPTTYWIILKIFKVEYLSNNLLDHTQNLNLSWDDQTIFYNALIWRWPRLEDDLKILKVKYLSNLIMDHTQILNLNLDDQTLFENALKWRRPPKEDDPQWKTTPNGRRLQNIKSWIYQQPFIGSYSNFKLKLRWPNKILQCLKMERPPIEDDLKILKLNISDTTYWIILLNLS